MNGSPWEFGVIKRHFNHTIVAAEPYMINSLVSVIGTKLTLGQQPLDCILIHSLGSKDTLMKNHNKIGGMF